MPAITQAYANYAMHSSQVGPSPLLLSVPPIFYVDVMVFAFYFQSFGLVTATLWNICMSDICGTWSWPVSGVH